LVAAVANGAHLVVRPRGFVVHVAAAGPLTPSGRSLPRSARTVCRCRAGRWHLYGAGVAGVAAAGLRFCRRCTAVLPASLGTNVTELVSRDDTQTAYGHMSVDDFAAVVAMQLCRPASASPEQFAQAVEESHQIGRVLSVVHGPAPVSRPATEGPAQVLHDLHQEIARRRKAFRARALTSDEQEIADRSRIAKADDVLRLNHAAREARAVARAQDRVTRGQYLTPHERELLNTA
jgi:hypothetical protein